MLTARAPAKLIISGEHAVVYGKPAIAMAIDRYTTATTAWQDNHNINFKFANLAYAKQFTIDSLNAIRIQLQQNYAAFLKGQLSINEVLTRPFELLQYAVSSLLHKFNLDLPNGVNISVYSNIPVGCGMGSSAAAVTSTLYALTNFLGIQWSPADYLQFAREIESLQHGKSSGLDVRLTAHGGCVRFQNGITESLDAPVMPMYLINTGQPVSSTGECVQQVANLFRDKQVADNFGQVTDRVQQALSSNNLVSFKQAIGDNHRLLQAIGVVPKKIANFIADIESQGGAAKICGAGAISGDNAGAVLLVCEHDLSAVVRDYGYEMQTIKMDKHGTQII